MKWMGKKQEVYFFNEEEKAAVNRFRPKAKEESARSSSSSTFGRLHEDTEKEKPRSFKMGKLSKLKRKNSPKKARHMHEKLYKVSAEII